MMIETIVASLDSAEPPQDLSRPLQALWWLKKGDLQLGPDWERAHAISQSAEGQKDFDWVHALAHWIEDDIGNSNYWYRRAGETRGAETIAQEWDHIVAQLSQ